MWVGHKVWGVAFSRDGRRIVADSEDKALRLWDVDTGQPIGDPMSRHQGWVDSVAFSPDSRRIVSGGAEGTVQLWDVDTGQPIGDPMTGDQGPVLYARFSPDGQRIVSVGFNKTLRLWPVPAHDPESWPEALCAKLTQNMSHQQWRDWISPDINYVEVCPGLPIPSDDTGR